MEMAAKGNRPCQVGLGAHRCQELHRVVGLEDISFVYLKVGLFSWSDNGDIKRLGILLHYKRLDIFAEDFVSVRIVLLVFVEHNLLSLLEVVFSITIFLVHFHQLLLVPG